jgi:ATP-binding cassette subfamily B protein
VLVAAPADVRTWTATGESPSDGDAAAAARLGAAVEIAAQTDDPETFPEGVDSEIGESGLRVSGGQRQLLALTRALVWEPRVLLLDEATAAIDGASDAAFRSALGRAMRERGDAVLTVAHRLSTAREADRVLVLEAGTIVEEGPPAALVVRGGRFAALVALEEAGLDWERTQVG